MAGIYWLAEELPLHIPGSGEDFVGRRGTLELVRRICERRDIPVRDLMVYWYLVDVEKRAYFRDARKAETALKAKRQAFLKKLSRTCNKR